MTHMLSLLPKSRFEESGVEIPGGLAFLADYRPDAIAEASAGIEGLFMPPSHPRLDADLLARLGSVRIIQTAGAGFDSVDHAAAAKLGLIVCNSPAQNAITVAEHVIGAVICLQRELAYADEAIKSGAYAQARERILGRGACELFGATVGIVGLGGIGRALAPALRPSGQRSWPPTSSGPKHSRRSTASGASISTSCSPSATSSPCTVRLWTPRAALWAWSGSLP